MFSSVLSARGQRAGVSLVTTVAKADLLILSGSLRKNALGDERVTTQVPWRRLKKGMLVTSLKEFVVAVGDSPKVAAIVQEPGDPARI